MKIIESKMRMPTCSPCLVRNRLFSDFNHYDSVSVISIIGDSGYGKTTLVSSYIRERNMPSIWYQLEGTDRYAHIFLTYLKVGIARLMGEDAPAAFIQPKDVEQELDAILALLSNRSEPLFIVLDDFQWVDQSPEIDVILQKLFMHCPAAITFIIISRVRPSLSFARAKIRQNYKEINTPDLAFTKEETAEFFNGTYNEGLKEHELDLIHQATEGWVASYQLILGVINKMNGEERLLFWSKFPDVPDIYEYLSVEVLESQEEETKQFLYKTSLLAELDANVIDQFLKVNDSRKIVNHLLKHHLFIYRDEEGVVRYHRLFRRFLYEKHKERSGNAVIINEHRQLADIYEGMYQYVHAFAHSIIGQDYPKAAKLMGMIRNRYNPVESMIFLDGWLEEISPGLSLANNTLFLIRCIPLATLKELTANFEQHISELLKERKNQLWLSSLQHRLATIFLMRGEIIKAKEYFLDSLNGSEKFHDYPMTALNLILLAEINRYLGKHEEALKCVRRALFLSEKHGIKHTQVHALDTIATIFLDEKKIEEAAPYIEQALQIASNDDRSSLVFIYTTMGRKFRIEGDVSQSIQWGTKAANLAEDYNIDFDIGWSNLELGQSYIVHNEWQAAESCLTKAYHAFSLFTYYRCLVVYSQMELYRKKGDAIRELEKRAELKKICEENDFVWMMEKLGKSNRVAVVKEPLLPLSIHVLGNFKIVYKNQPVTIKRNSSLRLLQYLITNRDKKVAKDILLEDVFPEGAMDSIQNQLHVSLSILRKALEPDLERGIQSRFISRSDNHYLFDTKEVYLDCKEFLELAACNDHKYSPETIEKFHRAEKLYKGDYFEEYPYEMFLETERERIRSLYFKMNRILANYYYSKREFMRSFDYFERILNKDPYQEQIYFEYIESLLKQKLSSQANNIAHQMINYVEKEIGIRVKDHLYQLFSKFHASPVF